SGFRQLGELWAANFRKMACLQPKLEVPQPLNRGSGLLEAVKGKVELAPVRDRGQQVTNGRRLVPQQNQVSESIEVAQALGHLLALNQQKADMHPEAH